MSEKLFLERRLKRCIGKILSFKEKEIDHSLSEDQASRLRSVILDEVNEFYSVVIDVLDNNINEAYLEILDRLDEIVIQTKE